MSPDESGAMAETKESSKMKGRTIRNLSNTDGVTKTSFATGRLLNPFRGRCQLWIGMTLCVFGIFLVLVPSLSVLGGVSAAEASSSSDATNDVAVVTSSDDVESCPNDEASVAANDDEDEGGGGRPALYPCTKSFLENFWHDELVKGFHIGCLSETEGQRTLTLYPNGLASRKWSSDPKTRNIDSWALLKQMLQSTLVLRDPDAGYNFQPYAIFSPEGRRLADGSIVGRQGQSVLDRLVENGVFLVYEGGQFLWPGVRVGFERNVSLYTIMPMGLKEENKAIDTNRTKATITTLSLSPLVLSIQGFLRDDECTHIQRKAEPRIQYSEVVLMDHDKGRPASDFRTSKSGFFSSAGDPILQDIDNRVASLTRIPRNHQEQVQVLRYGLTEKYNHHTDYFNPAVYKNDPITLKNIGYGRRNRLATVFWYLSDVPLGGETAFPEAFGYLPQHAMDCDGGLLVKPERGKVIIFYSLHMSGKPDPKSKHGACPVKEGTKWAANKWVWNEPMPYVK